MLAASFLVSSRTGRPTSRCLTATWSRSLRQVWTDKRKSHDPDAYCKVSSSENPIDALLRRDKPEELDQPAASRVAREREASSPTGRRPRSQSTVDESPRIRRPQNPARVLRESIVFDGHRRARPQVARPNGRDRTQSRRGYARDKTVQRGKKKATKAPIRAGRSQRRSANERASAKRRAQKRAASRSFGKRRASLREPQPKKAPAR